MRLAILLVDDEPHARRYLRELLTQDEDVEVIHECKNGQEVLNFLKTKEPHIIFLDINMPGISGVEVAEQLKSTSSLIVFSTAYDQYALKAFEVAAFDYLVKPYGEERFFNVLNRAKELVNTQQQASFSQKFADLYKAYNQTLSPHLTEFVLKEKGFEKKIGVQEICYIEASGIYAVLHLENETMLYRAALNLLEEQLPPNFLRVHRAFIINTDWIASIKYLNNSTYRIVMQNQEVIVSSRKYKEVLSQLSFE
jgi:two-component system LytT family response regulator